MTDNEFRNPLPPPRPPGPPVRHLYRAIDKKRWLGVAKGLADYTGAPVGVLRLAFFLLSFAGGLGLFAYLAAAALIPKVGEVNSLGDRISGGRPDRLLAAIAGIAVAAYAFFNGGSFDLLAVAVLASAGYYLWTKDRPATARPNAVGGPTWPQPAAGTSSAGQPAQDAPDWQTWKPDVDVHDDFGLVPPPPYVPPSLTVPARVPAVARKRGWGWASLAASIGTMVVLSPFANVFTVLFGGFIVLLVGFVVGLFARRPSWALLLPLLGLLTLLPFARWYSNADVPLNGKSGELILTAVDVNGDSAERALSAGHIEVDLRSANVGQLKYRIGAGQIEVLVPSNVGYDLRSKVSLGNIRIAGQVTAGTGVTMNRTEKPDGALRVVALDLEVGIGDITIVRTEPELGKS